MRKIFLMGIAVLFLITSCSAADVVQKDAVRAFGEIMSAASFEEYESGRWKLTAPDESALFGFDNTSVDMVVDAQPFVNAGADLSKLINAGEHGLNPGKDSIWFPSQSFDMLNQNKKTAALDQFAYDVKCLRKYLGYHEEKDHFNIELNGAMFEWAKDLSAVGKTGDGQTLDIVFVLNPEPLLAAGVNPDRVEGWDYATVKVLGDNGRMVEVERFVKGFDLG